jgi:N-methylhydantoinase A
MVRVGIDAGGTFTDCVATDESGSRVCKLRSRPDDPAAVVEEALARLVPAGAPVEIVFSTTAATNALVERKGGPTILITTAGFEDVLEIGRQARPVLYALHPQKTPPLVGVEDRLGAAERVAIDGEVLVPLTEGEVERLAAIAGDKPQATIAICLLHGHAHPAHERRLAERLRARGRTVSVSSEVCPLPREYERTSTTVVDAYVAPRLGETLHVGAGGGSIAWIDGGGALRVGPRSAGARPGPAAYGQGGLEPTVTDAHLLLGRLGVSLAGGAVALDAAAPP